MPREGRLVLCKAKVVRSSLIEPDLSLSLSLSLQSSTLQTERVVGELKYKDDGDLNESGKRAKG